MSAALVIVYAWLVAVEVAAVVVWVIATRKQRLLAPQLESRILYLAS
jgi:hypothetical protein